jgi:hypothetical protein
MAGLQYRRDSTGFTPRPAAGLRINARTAPFLTPGL